MKLNSNIIPTVPEAYAWDSQAIQYPIKGEPGISYFRGDMGEKYVDCYLYRNAEGLLLGILNYYPFDFPPYEIIGNVNIWVHPKHQRQGVATKLLDKIMSLHDININQQQYTESGLKFIKSYAKRIK